MWAGSASAGSWLSSPVRAQGSFGTPNTASGLTVSAERPFRRELLTLEVAKAAAENGSQDLSIDAFVRFVEHFPKVVQTAVPGNTQPIKSSLLSSAENRDPFATATASSRVVQGYTVDPINLIPPMLELIQTWKKEKFDATKVASALEKAVLPAANPKAVDMFVFGLRQERDQP